MDTIQAKNSTNVRDSNEIIDIDPPPSPVLQSSPTALAPPSRRHAAAAPWRKPGWRSTLLRAGMSALSRLSPDAAAHVFDRIWFTAPQMTPRADADACLRSAERMTLQVHGRPVAAWSWGAGPAVLLVHGWGGCAGQMHAFVAPLLAAGFRVLAFDAPSHGESGSSRLGGRRVSFIEIAEALRVVCAATGPVAGLIAHSGGCTVAALAIRDGWRPPSRMVFLAPFAWPGAMTEAMGHATGVDDTVLDIFRRRVERRQGRPWSDFDIPRLPEQHGVPPLLLIHDTADAEVPYAGSEAVLSTWPRARLIATQGLGHRKLVRDPSVVAQALEFIAPAGSVPVPAATPADARSQLDREFETCGFDRRICGIV